MSPEKLAAAVQLIKSGNKQAAIPLLREIIQANPQDENAWLWLYACVDSVEQKKACLQKVLAINPGNQSARKALAKLDNPPAASVPQRKKPAGRRPLFAILGGAALLLVVCAASLVFLAQSGMVASFGAASLPTSTAIATTTPSPSATATETTTPSPSPSRTATATPTITPTPSEVVEITWLNGFGFSSNRTGGIDRAKLEIVQSVVEDFNASQGYIHLNMEFTNVRAGTEKFRADIITGNGADILGPMLIIQGHEFHSQWLDLTPYINTADLEAYHPAQVETFRTKEGQVSLPFLAHPSALAYNPKLFDAAGLKYPPAHYGEKYEMSDGSQVEWNWDTLATVARLLTLDSTGLNATQEGFDKERIVQYGYTWNVPHPTYIGSYWGDGSLFSEEARTAHIPEAWHAAWEWTFNGIWSDQPFIPTGKVGSSVLFGSFASNIFNSGKIGMAIQSTFSIASMSIETWDVAAIPSYNGQPGGQVEVESFFIWKGSKHPHEAYIAMSYLINQAVPKLIDASDPFFFISARKDQPHAWIDIQKAHFPLVTNWNAFVDGLEYAETPNVVSYIPNFRGAWAAGSAFQSRVFGEPNLDFAAEELAYLNNLKRAFVEPEFYP